MIQTKLKFFFAADILMPGVKFTNILRAVIAPLFLHQKKSKPKCKYEEAAHETYVWKAARKMLVKYILGMIYLKNL